MGTTRVWQEAATTLLPWRTLMPTVAYCLRTLTAMALALYVAFWLQLEAPSSAAITVLIVANPTSGALISKSFWRLFATLVGAMLAVVLIAAFAQSPMLFFLSFSLCIGAACVVSTLLRYFKAYAAVLAGYTIIIVCAPAFASPDSIFVSALSRVSAVSVGIVSAALVFLLTGIRSPSSLPDAAIALIRSTGAALCAQLLGEAGSTDGRGHSARVALLTQANTLQETIEYAAADSYGVATRASALRFGAAGVLGAASSLHPMRASMPEDHPLAGPVRDAIAGLQSMTRQSCELPLRRLEDVCQRLAADLDQAPSHPPDLAGIAAIDRTLDLLSRLHNDIRYLMAPSGGRSPWVRLRLFLDWPTALRNGARGGIVTMLACLFWYITQWPSGPTLLSYLVPAACLLATNPSAARASVDFSIGTLLAIPASWICETFMLPQIDGFPLLIAALGVCLLPGIWLQFHPRYGLRAFGYVVFFNAMIAVRNPVRFDDMALLNGWLAFAIGTASLIVVFRALLPANAIRDSNRLAHSIARAAEGTGRRPPGRPVWEFLQAQKLLRLIQRLQPLDPSCQQRVTDDAMIAIELGRSVLRLRAMLAQARLPPSEHQTVADACREVSRVRRDPAQASRRVAVAARALAAPPSASAMLARIAALLYQIATLIEADQHFLSQEYRVADAG